MCVWNEEIKSVEFVSVTKAFLVQNVSAQNVVLARKSLPQEQRRYHDYVVHASHVPFGDAHVTYMYSPYFKILVCLHGASAAMSNYCMHQSQSRNTKLAHCHSSFTQSRVHC